LEEWQTVLQDFLHWMGLGLCHQLPERSFFAGNMQVPVCARDTGIYLGFLISFALISLIHRGERPRGFPSPALWTIMGISLATMAWDGITSYAGFRTTTNDIRLVTGLLTGFSVAVLVFPMVNEELWAASTSRRVLDSARRIAIWALGIPVAFAFIRWVAPQLGIAYPVIVAVSIVLTLAAINLIIVAMLPAFDRKGRSWSDLTLPIAIAVALAFLEIAGAAQIRVFLEALAARIG
jgi:uncharacterized membrane protein